jgi:hypothetical protein
MGCEFLSECRQAYEDTEAHIDRLYSELSSEQLGWTPDEGSWSILQCIDHLTVVRERHLKELRVAVQDGREKRINGGEAPYGGDTKLGEFLLTAFEAPEKLETFDIFQAADRPDPEEVAQGFKEQNAILIALADDADGLDLGRIEVGAPNPEIGVTSLAEGFQLHVKHDARHLAQAEAVREEAGFPE